MDGVLDGVWDLSAEGLKSETLPVGVEDAEATV